MNGVGNLVELGEIGCQYVPETVRSHTFSFLTIPLSNFSGPDRRLYKMYKHDLAWRKNSIIFPFFKPLCNDDKFGALTKMSAKNGTGNIPQN